MITALDHIAIAVPSIEEASGAELLRERPGPGAEGATVQFVHPKSAGGVLVELSEPAS